MNSFEVSPKVACLMLRFRERLHVYNALWLCPLESYVYGVGCMLEVYVSMNGLYS